MTAMTGPDLAACLVMAAFIVAVSAWCVAKWAGWLR